jgi:hypothetical protein
VGLFEDRQKAFADQGVKLAKGFCRYAPWARLAHVSKRETWGTHLFIGIRVEK